MPDPWLIPSLATLRAEFNALSPGRDRASDGWIGDTAHAATESDHNPDERGAVHAIDVDRDLRLPGASMEQVVQFLLRRCRAGQETRLKYIIYDRRIWSASSDWVEKAYSGANPHDKHAHFSGKYDTTNENKRIPYGLLKEFDMPITDAEFDQIEARARAGAEAALRGQISTGGGSRDGALSTMLDRSNYLANRLPAILLAAIAAAPASGTIDLDTEDLNALAEQVIDGISDEFAESLLNKLQVRLQS